MSSSESNEILTADHETRSSGWDTCLPCDPTRRCHRYLILFLICFLVFGSYFCYDNPVALEDKIMIDMGLSATAYMSFYSWYSWPNVVLSFIGGFLIDRVFGVRLGALIFSLLITVGQLIFSWGVYINNYALAVFGRFIFGVGGENLGVAQSTYTSLWFRDTELNFIFGLQLTLSRIGSVLNLNSMNPLYNSLPGTGYRRLGVTMFIASLTCLLSFICAVILALFDRRAERILQRQRKGSNEKKISLSDIRHFSAALWLICGICVAFYNAVYPFISLANIFIIQKYGKNPENAAFITSLIYIVSASSSSVLGFIIDQTGRNVMWVLIGTLITLACHILYAFTFVEPIIVSILFGTSLAIIASSLWSMVVFVVPQSQRGTAFGIMQSAENLGLAVIGIISGTLQDNYGFLVLEIFFSVWLCFTLILIVILYLWDIDNEMRLNESGFERRNRSKISETTERSNRDD